MGVAERTQTSRRTGARIVTGKVTGHARWFDPPESIPRKDHDLWFKAVNEVQRSCGEKQIAGPGCRPPAAEQSAMALYALHDLAQKMLTEAQANSYVSNTTSSSDMDPTVPAGFVDSLEDRSTLTRNF